MSTTIKRVALVAVAALGLGTVSVIAPTAANATVSWTGYASEEKPFVVTVADTVSNGADYDATEGVWESGTAAAAVSVTQVAGLGNYVELSAKSNDTTTATYVTVTVTGTTLTVGAQPTSGADTFTVNTAGTVATSLGKTINGAKLRVAVPTVGTYTATVAKVVVAGGISTITDQQVFTITGTASATRGVIVLANSTSYITDSSTVIDTSSNLKGATLAADAAVLKAKTTAQVAAIRVVLKDGQATPVGVNAKELVAVVTGSGLVSAFSGTAARVASVTTDTDGYAGFVVYGDGTAGVGTITITQGTTVVATETVTFTGALANLTATPVSTVLSTTNGADLEWAIEVKATDAAGNLVTGLAAGFTASSSDAAVLSSTITVDEGTTTELAAGDSSGPGYYYINVKSAAAGTIASGAKATLTVKYVLSATSTISTTAVPFTTGGATIYGVALTSDVASALAGDKVTLTLAATDKAGNPVADGSYVVFDTATATAGALTSSQTLTSKLFGTGKIAFVAGKATSSFYAPYSKVTISGKLGAAAPIATALQATAITPLVVDVSNPGVDAATDAANEAAQAASDATDAALAAADAADAATTKAQEAVDAVATLSAQVSKLITALKAQITTLTNLVIKIQKKVKA